MEAVFLEYSYSTGKFHYLDILKPMPEDAQTGAIRTCATNANRERGKRCTDNKPLQYLLQVSIYNAFPPASPPGVLGLANRKTVPLACPLQHTGEEKSSTMFSQGSHNTFLIICRIGSTQSFLKVCQENTPFVGNAHFIYDYSPLGAQQAKQQQT